MRHRGAPSQPCGEGGLTKEQTSALFSKLALLHSKYPPKPCGLKQLFSSQFRGLVVQTELCWAVLLVLADLRGLCRVCGQLAVLLGADGLSHGWWPAAGFVWGDVGTCALLLSSSRRPAWTSSHDSSRVHKRSQRERALVRKHFASLHLYHFWLCPFGQRKACGPVGFQGRRSRLTS